MGFIKVKAFIWNIFDPKKSREVEFLADTGAIYTVLPETLLNQLNIRKIGRRKFRLADNRIVERDIGIIGIIRGIRSRNRPNIPKTKRNGTTITIN